nr:immunoglobulin light chain junction region [Macaca mulatta]MOX79057.1 immunoglobulin light chain junction region [Macaca mulatta]MOX79214.1 immunoglobulin light chain junction region [Macaca mulatta]MOX79771.1 immunoglobulin light chain junction region [Macaca mulatta]MOX81286.1 immunoglobulin light chain junction region [Macaca mulatta]
DYHCYSRDSSGNHGLF